MICLPRLPPFQEPRLLSKSHNGIIATIRRCCNFLSPALVSRGEWVAASPCRLCAVWNRRKQHRQIVAEATHACSQTRRFPMPVIKYVAVARLQLDGINFLLILLLSRGSTSRNACFEIGVGDCAREPLSRSNPDSVESFFSELPPQFARRHLPGVFWVEFPECDVQHIVTPWDVSTQHRCQEVRILNFILVMTQRTENL
mmetsp:Transcript_86928/g.153946  ORF Transcript_86928/g.153946 Transcript_86928/m.153946 type:complete len:200 (-) Transcript_86928:1233-1832(-)